MNDFVSAARLGSCLAKAYAPDMFRLLATYRSLSASEAASRLDLHVQTAQTFLETLTSLGVLDKHESTDKTRPYFRYTLKVSRVTLEVDFSTLSRPGPPSSLSRLIRERRSSGARFVPARGRNAISTVVAWVGTGRDRQERRINLTQAQGAFLFLLPFPSDEPRSVSDLLRDAAIDDAHTREVLDLIERLDSFGAIEARTD